MTFIPRPIRVEEGGTNATSAGTAKTNLGMGNVDNTTDANKPVSTAQQTALNAKVPTTRTVNSKALSSDISIASTDIADFTSAVNALVLAGHQVATGTITRLTSDASGTQAITLAFQPAFCLFSFLDNTDATANSDGWDDGTTATCSSIFSTNFLLTLVGALGLASLSTKSHVLSIWIQNASGNGHQAKISAKSGTGFTLSWTKLASGRNITGKYLAVQ